MTLASTFKRPRWGMPITISFTPSWPPRLMICSSAGTIDSPPSRPKRLVPVYFDVEEALEDLGLDQLLQDRLPSALGEGHLVAFDAVLDPRPLLGVRDVHVLDADRAAIGALQDVEHLAHGAEFEPESAAEIDRTVVVGLGEAVGLGLELGMLAAADELERIELGDEMAARAIGADQQAQAERIARGGNAGLLGGEVRREAAATTPAPKLRRHWVPRMGRAPRRGRRRGRRRGWRRTRATQDRANEAAPGSARRARRDRWRWRLRETTCWQTRRSVRVWSLDQPCRSLKATGVPGKQGERWAPASPFM